MPDKLRDTDRFVKIILGIFASLILIGVMTLMNQSQGISENKTSCKVLSTQQEFMRETLREIKADVKELLKYQRNGRKKNE